MIRAMILITLVSLAGACHREHMVTPSPPQPAEPATSQPAADKPDSSSGAGYPVPSKNPESIRVDEAGRPMDTPLPAAPRTPIPTPIMVDGQPMDSPPEPK